MDSHFCTSAGGGGGPRLVLVPDKKHDCQGLFARQVNYTLMKVVDNTIVPLGPDDNYFLREVLQFQTNNGGLSEFIKGGGWTTVDRIPGRQRNGFDDRISIGTGSPPTVIQSFRASKQDPMSGKVPSQQVFILENGAMVSAHTVVREDGRIVVAGTLPNYVAASCGSFQ